MYSLRIIVIFVLFQSVVSIRNADLPIPANGSALEITISLTFMDVSSIKLLDMDYRLDYFVTFEWKVDRIRCDAYISQLKTNKIVDKKPQIGDEYLVRGFEKLTFWKPDIYIPEVKRHESPTTSGNHYSIMILVESNDTCSLKYDSRAAAIVACQMNFRGYPYDRQYCPMRIRSHYYPLRLLMYRWSKRGIRASKRIRLNDYKYSFNYSEFYNVTIFDDELYSWLEVDFVFERKMSYFVVQVYCPSILILTIAYMSVWLHVGIGMPRFSLTVGTFLTIVTQFIGVKAQIPRVSYVTVIDIWMLSCMLFVWSVIAELVISNYLHRRMNVIIDHRKVVNERGKKFFEEGSEVSILQKGLLMAKEGHPKLLTSKFTIESELNIDDMIEEPDLALCVDKFFRVLYPIAFLVFNGVFWTLMLQRKLL